MNDAPKNHDVPHDLDDLLTDWHRENRRAAEAARDRVLGAVGARAARGAGDAVAPALRPRRVRRPGARRGVLAVIGGRSVRAAASLLLLAGVVAILAPWPSSPAFALEVMVPDGGRLEALDERGAVIGPCPLEHTDVDVDVSGRFARVTLRQRFHNEYDRKIEAVYTFPLSHRGAVDRMTMTIGDRVVVGEIKERGEARRVYEAARAQGYVASLLEQERPNIFTQSVANIEPHATILVEISYVETVAIADGVYRFDFPMVVAPRYIPGAPVTSRAFVPAELESRRGVILRGPARLTPGRPPEPGAENEAGRLGTLTPGRLQALLEAAQPVAYPGAVWWGEGADAKLPGVWQPFEARYVDGSKEIGWLYTDGTGQINGRWFFTDPRLAADLGPGFAADTDQVPDASRITPMPVRPPTRAGHDIALTMTIDTGGPGILGVDSELHEIVGDEAVRADGEGPSRLTLSLRDRREIPNRDFLLTWRVAEDEIEEAHFAHRSNDGPKDGAPNGDAGFFTLMLQPPARVADADLRRRELIFVLDSSGSMKDRPIEKAKGLMTRAIETMRPGDTFNVITFNNTSDCLWDAPRPNTEENRRAARAYVDGRQGGGGTEMRDAVLAALRPEPARLLPLTPAALADLPADGRTVTVRVRGENMMTVGQDGAAPSVVDIHVSDGLTVRAQIRKWTISRSIGFEPPMGRTFTMRGEWTTRDGRRVLDVRDAREVTEEEGAAAVRFVFFLSDGEVGNDDAIVEAVRQHAGRTRMFTVAIGNSPNRSLLDAMAKAGRGRADYLSLEGDTRAAVERFVRRIERPVLTDIAITFEGVQVHDTIPPLDEVPDLFDEEPLVIHGRYAAPGRGTLRLTGQTGRGRYDRVVDVDLPEHAPDHDVIATLWARAKVDERMEAGDRAGVIALGETFGIVTAHTSFVAVEKSRLTIGGAPMLVSVPIEMPAGQAWQGTFGGGEGGDPDWNERQVEMIEHLGQDPAALERVAARLVSAATAPADADSIDADFAPLAETDKLARLADAGREAARSRGLALLEQDLERSFARIPIPRQVQPSAEAQVPEDALFFDGSDASFFLMSRDSFAAYGIPPDNAAIPGASDFALIADLPATPDAGVVNLGAPVELHRYGYEIQKSPREVMAQSVDAGGRALRENSVALGEAPRLSDYGTVTLSVQDTDVGQVLEMLSIQEQKTIVVSGDVSGTVSADVAGLSFYEALDAVLFSNGLSYVEEGNSIYVYEQAEMDEIRGSPVGNGGPTAGEARPDEAVGAILSEVLGHRRRAPDHAADLPEGTTTLSVQDADLAQVLEMLSIRFQVNIIISKGVSATVSANLYDVTFAEAMYAILRPIGFEYIQRGNLIYVCTRPELDAMEPVDRGRPPSPDHAVLLAVTLAEAGRADAALRLVEWIRRAWPDFEPAARLLDPIQDAALPDDERAARLRNEARAIRERIAQTAAAHRRAAAAARVLAEPLWPLAFPDRFDDDARREASKLLDADARVLVTLLAARGSALPRRALEQAGLTIDDTARSLPLVVGRARTEALVDIALVAGTCRIEPTR